MPDEKKPVDFRPLIKRLLEIVIAAILFFLAARYGIVVPSTTYTTTVVLPDGKVTTATVVQDQ